MLPRKGLVIATWLFCVVCALATAKPGAAEDRQGTATSNQDKIKACNDLADKRNLKGDDRKNFLHDCISKTTDVKPLSEMSQKEKLDVCKNLADKKNLKGEERRTFLKDCMSKANPK